MYEKIYRASDIAKLLGVSTQSINAYMRMGYLKPIPHADLPLEYVVSHNVRRSCCYFYENGVNRFLHYRANGGFLGNRSELKLVSDDFDLEGIMRNRYNPVIVCDNGVYNALPKEVLQRICDINLIDFREELS